MRLFLFIPIQVQKLPSDSNIPMVDDVFDRKFQSINLNDKFS